MKSSLGRGLRVSLALFATSRVNNSWKKRLYNLFMFPISSIHAAVNPFKNFIINNQCPQKTVYYLDENGNAIKISQVNSQGIETVMGEYEYKLYTVKTK